MKGMKDCRTQERRQNTPVKCVVSLKATSLFCRSLIYNCITQVPILTALAFNGLEFLNYTFDQTLYVCH